MQSATPAANNELLLLLWLGRLLVADKARDRAEHVLRSRPYASGHVLRKRHTYARLNGQLDEALALRDVDGFPLHAGPQEDASDALRHERHRLALETLQQHPLGCTTAAVRMQAIRLVILRCSSAEVIGYCLLWSRVCNKLRAMVACRKHGDASI